MLRAELRRIVEGLVGSTVAGGEVTLDALGDAIGAMAITPIEIEQVIDAVEAAGRTVGSAPGGDGEARLVRVLGAARELRAELGRAPTAGEVAERAQMSLEAVRHALALARVMQR